LPWGHPEGAEVKVRPFLTSTPDGGVVWWRRGCGDVI
jgi:hypothetical protein